MRLLFVILLLIVSSTSVWSQDNDLLITNGLKSSGFPYEMRCLTTLCFNSLHPEYSTWTIRQQELSEYNVEGHKISFYINRASKYLQVTCEGTDVLDSNSMPRFTHEQNFSILKLENCHLPVNRSLIEVFSLINATLNLNSLELDPLPKSSPLKSTHFLNLTRLELLKIDSDDAVPADAILTDLTSLKYLVVTGVVLSYQDLSTLPRSLNCLTLFGSALNSLPKTLNSTLAVLKQPYRIWLGTRDCSIAFRGLGWTCNDKPKALSGSPVEEVVLDGWSEDDVVALDSCESLQELEIRATRIKSLPARWLANCPNLKKLEIKGNLKTIRLHENVLEGSSLEHLLVQNSDLEIKDKWWLKYVRNLTDVRLPWDRITVV